MKPKIVAIAAMDEARVIGNRGALPWKLPGDMKRFSALTTGHTVVMGRKTYDSLPPKFRPLPNRKNVVVTRNLTFDPGAPDVEVWDSPTQFLDACRANRIALPTPLVWVLGGAEIYAATVDFWDEIELTLVPGTHEGDTWFPPFESKFELVEEHPGDGCRYQRYRRKIS